MESPVDCAHVASALTSDGHRAREKLVLRAVGSEPTRVTHEEIEQRMRLFGARPELRMELTAQHERVIRDFSNFDQRQLQIHPAAQEP